MSEARDLLERYLARTGLSHPADAAQQYQVALMRQWTGHLDEVLDANHVEPGLRSRIVREFIYGAVPQEAEAGIRQEMTREMSQLIESVHREWPRAAEDTSSGWITPGGNRDAPSP